MSLRRLTSTLLIYATILAFLAAAHADSSAAGADTSLQGTRVAITVDDIPDHGDLLPSMSRVDIARGFIRIFKDNQIADVFGFTNGNFMPDNPQELAIFKLWLDAGYPLGNHTYDHPNLNQVGATRFIADIATQNALLATLSGYSPLVERRFMFRYPFLDEGDTLKKRNAVRAYLAKNGYRIAEVTTDYYDWAWTDAYTRCLSQYNQQQIDWLKGHVTESADQHLRESNAISDRLFNRRIPHVLLIHDGSFDVLTLDAVLKHWHSEGVVFISLKEALADAAYQINPNYAYKDGLDFLEQISASRHVDISDLESPAYSIDQLNAVCKAKVTSDSLTNPQ